MTAPAPRAAPTRVCSCIDYCGIAAGATLADGFHCRVKCQPAERATPRAATPEDDRRVVCAAIRAADGSVLLGIRHYSRDMHVQIESRRDGHKFVRRNGDDQGFVDQWGTYMTRSEAYKVAEKAGQVLHPGYCGNTLDGPELYSEGLY